MPKTMRLLLTLFLFAILIPTAFAEQFQAVGTVNLYFSPRGGATEAIVNEINMAKNEILVQAYSFTSKPIAKALVDAKKRGVNIIAVLDKSQHSEKYSSADFLARANIPTFIDDNHAIAHNKIILIDKAIVITGSFNFTKAAEEKNAENLLILKGNLPLVNRYIKEFERHERHSEVYKGR